MNAFDSPFFIFGLSLITLILSVRLGTWLQRSFSEGRESRHTDLTVVTTASLTLLALLIGFSFSMAASRFDLRRNFEVQEARQISAEYLRADLLPPQSAAQIKTLLAGYIDQRIRFYNSSDATELLKIKLATNQVQNQLWTMIRVPAMAAPSSITALPVEGVDSIVGARNDAEAAWSNRIPPTAAFLLLIIAAVACMLSGFAARSPKSRLHFILPLLVSITFFLIADIENPRIGIIRVYPSDLVAAADSMHAR